MHHVTAPQGANKGTAGISHGPCLREKYSVSSVPLSPVPSHLPRLTCPLSPAPSHLPRLNAFGARVVHALERPVDVEVGWQAGDHAANLFQHVHLHTAQRGREGGGEQGGGGGEAGTGKEGESEGAVVVSLSAWGSVQPERSNSWSPMTLK